jgi:hypothetical protein
MPTLQHPNRIGGVRLEDSIIETPDVLKARAKRARYRSKIGDAEYKRRAELSRRKNELINPERTREINAGIKMRAIARIDAKIYLHASKYLKF